MIFDTEPGMTSPLRKRAIPFEGKADGKAGRMRWVPSIPITPPHPPHCARHILIQEKARVDGEAGRMRC